MRLDGGAERHAGVVEDQVDLAVVGDDLVGPGVHRVAIGDVDPVRRDLHARALAQHDGLGETDLVDVAQGQMCAALCERRARAPARCLTRRR